MATPKSGRQSRKRRKARAAARVPGDPPAGRPGGLGEPAPRSAREALTPRPYVRRGAKAGQQAAPSLRGSRASSDTASSSTMMGTYGERPPNPFGGVPVSEIAILAGAVAAVYGLIGAAPAALAVGLVICTLGVAEFSAREHFSGYRSHTTMLAAIPAIGVGIAMIALIGGSLSRAPLLVVVVAVFAVCFWPLRKRFRAARHARIAKPPAP